MSLEDAAAYGAYKLPPPSGSGPRAKWQLVDRNDPRVAHLNLPKQGDAAGWQDWNPAFHPPNSSTLAASRSLSPALPQPKVVKTTILPAVTGNPSKDVIMRKVARILKRYRCHM